MSELSAKIVVSEDGYYYVVVSYDNTVMDRIPCNNLQTAEKVQECILYEEQRRETSELCA